MFVAAPRARLLLLGAGAVLLAGLALRSLRRRRAASGAIVRSPARTGDPTARTLVRVDSGGKMKKAQPPEETEPGCRARRAR